VLLDQCNEFASSGLGDHVVIAEGRVRLLEQVKWKMKKQAGSLARRGLEIPRKPIHLPIVNWQIRVQNLGVDYHEVVRSRVETVKGAAESILIGREAL
jgi:hypothetical protein